MNRPCPPVFVREYPAPTDEPRLQAKHAASVLQYHFVMSTWGRRGVFSRDAAESVAENWRRLELEQCFALCKVSFVPDHVHLAVRVHPSVSPARLFVHLMNDAQQNVWARFSQNVVRAAVERLWQSSGYIGSYGQLASPQIGRYIASGKPAPARSIEREDHGASPWHRSACCSAAE